MIYEFQSKTGEIITKNFSIGKAPDKITSKGIKYERIISIPMMVVVGLNEPKTVGSFMDKKKAKDEKEGKYVVKKQKKPWWRKKDKPDLGLATMSKKQTENYIMTGNKNG